MEAGELVQLFEDAFRRVLSEQRPAESEWINTEAAAALIGEHPKTTARRARTGEIPAKRLGNQWRFRRSDVLASIEGSAP